MAQDWPTHVLRQWGDETGWGLGKHILCDNGHNTAKVVQAKKYWLAQINFALGGLKRILIKSDFPVRDYTSAPIGPPLTRRFMNDPNAQRMQHVFIVAEP